MEKFYYSLMILLVILLGFLLILSNKQLFEKKRKALFLSSSLVAVFYLIWDVYFTSQAFWSYNFRSTLNIDLLGVPFENILYVFAVLLTGLILFETIKNQVTEAAAKNAGRLLFGGIFGISLLIIVPSYGHWFTTLVMALTFIGSIYILYSDPPWIGHFSIAFIFLLIPVYFIQQVLTGNGFENEIISYSSRAIMGKRFGSMPFEELFLLFVLFLWNCLFYEWFKK